MAVHIVAGVAINGVLAFVKKNPWSVPLAIALILIPIMIVGGAIYGVVGVTSQVSGAKSGCSQAYTDAVNNVFKNDEINKASLNKKCAATAAPPAGGDVVVNPEGWTYPLSGPFKVSDCYGPRVPPGGGVGSGFHQGFDLNQGTTNPILAAHDGVVVYAGGTDAGLGNHVQIDHGGGIKTEYGHMAWGSLLVQVGDQVKAGQQIGTIGTTGSSTGEHLHFNVYTNGTQINPGPFMRNIGLPLDVYGFMGQTSCGTNGYPI